MASEIILEIDLMGHHDNSVFESKKNQIIFVRSRDDLY